MPRTIGIKLLIKDPKFVGEDSIINEVDANSKVDGAKSWVNYQAKTTKFKLLIKQSSGADC